MGAAERNLLTEWIRKDTFSFTSFKQLWRTFGLSHLWLVRSPLENDDETRHLLLRARPFLLALDASTRHLRREYACLHEDEPVDEEQLQIATGCVYALWVLQRTQPSRPRLPIMLPLRWVKDDADTVARQSVSYSALASAEEAAAVSVSANGGHLYKSHVAALLGAFHDLACDEESPIVSPYRVLRKLLQETSLCASWPIPQLVLNREQKDMAPEMALRDCGLRFDNGRISNTDERVVTSLLEASNQFQPLPQHDLASVEREYRRVAARAFMEDDDLAVPEDVCSTEVSEFVRARVDAHAALTVSARRAFADQARELAPEARILYFTPPTLVYFLCVTGKKTDSTDSKRYVAHVPPAPWNVKYEGTKKRRFDPCAEFDKVFSPQQLQDFARRYDACLNGHSPRARAHASAQLQQHVTRPVMYEVALVREQKRKHLQARRLQQQQLLMEERRKLAARKPRKRGRVRRTAAPAVDAGVSALLPILPTAAAQGIPTAGAAPAARGSNLVRFDDPSLLPELQQMLALPASADTAGTQAGAQAGTRTAGAPTADTLELTPAHALDMFEQLGVPLDEQQRLTLLNDARRTEAREEQAVPLVAGEIVRGTVQPQPAEEAQPAQSLVSPIKPKQAPREQSQKTTLPFADGAIRESDTLQEDAKVAQGSLQALLQSQSEGKKKKKRTKKKRVKKEISDSAEKPSAEQDAPPPKKRKKLMFKPQSKPKGKSRKSKRPPP
ncbi:MAG: hypothetical protein MHM6MM_000453 [Cercozoa sp. M6MM]